MSEKQAQYYDYYWQTMRQDLPTPAITPLQKQLFSTYVTPETAVLDVGCGDGQHYGYFLASITSAYYGIDVSDVAVESACQNGIGEDFALFNTLPIISSLAARVVGWQRLKNWSTSLEFMARWWPSLYANHLFVVATRS